MEALDPSTCFMVADDFLDFSLDGGCEDEDKATTKDPSSSSFEYSNPSSQGHPDDQTRLFTEFAEEELEWLSNKDAFPTIETCPDILSESPCVVHKDLSPVSILDHSSSSSSNSNSSGSTMANCCGGIRIPLQCPVRPRSKRRRLRRRGGFPDLPCQQFRWWNQEKSKDVKQEPALQQRTAGSATIGRRCQHCQAEKTPQWRAGPMGPKTLCNACGVRYKSGRLVPEYRPANSPTFSSALHSNSHRKVIEMRRQKQLAMAEIGINEACGYRVG